jgi:8-oxo-dGTP pyrophosphatase MutT (NUDIX family)
MSRMAEDVEISAGGIVLAEADGTLHLALLRRRDGGWVLPKGHREPQDADLRATAIREVREELGLDPGVIDVERKLDAYTSCDTFGTQTVQKVNQFFMMRLRGKGAPLPRLLADVDHVDARWWSISGELPSMHYAHQRALLSEAVEPMLGFPLRFASAA